MQTVIGLMSGTSLDGIDAALIRTDGQNQLETGPWVTVPYADDFKGQLRAILGRQEAPDELVAALTHKHAEAVSSLLTKAQGWGGVPALIGFHGQTIYHAPHRPSNSGEAQGLTVQIGDGAELARLTGIDVVCDFRSADVLSGGEGAPLVPAYHQALAHALDKPLVVLNIGGVANITYLGPSGELMACDTGPGNALIDDWMLRHGGVPVDEGGAAAAQGHVDEKLLGRMLEDPFFEQPLPKSLDRQAFARYADLPLSMRDGAATLTAFTAAAVARSFALLPAAPHRLLVTGGGRHNPTLMRFLERYCQLKPEPVEAVGWQGDALEAQAFAYLAMRSRLGLPLSYPLTTGVKEPMTGGRYYAAPSLAASALAGPDIL